MNRNASRQYLKQVEKFLICDRKSRRRLLARCGELVRGFQEENPEAGYEGLVAAFGEPAACAAELLSGLDTSSVEDARKILFVNRSVFAAIILVLALISCFLFYKYLKKYLKMREFNEDAILVIEPPIRITEEEVAAQKARQTQ